MKNRLTGFSFLYLLSMSLQAEIAPKPTQLTKPAPEPLINCHYQIPADKKNIEDSLILSWSEKAASQAFTFEPNSMDAQMKELKNCFTEQGWASFNSALKESGNLDTIKTQKLSVKNQLKSPAKLVETKSNQWKVVLPLQVIYQNDKEKVTQSLTVHLNLTRKPNGDLGITQMVAAPVEVANPATKTESKPQNPLPQKTTAPNQTIK